MGPGPMNDEELSVVYSRETGTGTSAVRHAVAVQVLQRRVRHSVAVGVHLSVSAKATMHGAKLGSARVSVSTARHMVWLPHHYAAKQGLHGATATHLTAMLASKFLSSS